MTSRQWRPEDWENPCLGIQGFPFKHELCGRTYEAGADALLEKLREQAYARQTIINGTLRYIGHPDSNSELKSGRFVFIPDDEQTLR